MNIINSTPGFLLTKRADTKSDIAETELYYLSQLQNSSASSLEFVLLLPSMWSFLIVCYRITVEHRELIFAALSASFVLYKRLKTNVLFLLIINFDFTKFKMCVVLPFPWCFIRVWTQLPNQQWKKQSRRSEGSNIFEPINLILKILERNEDGESSDKTRFCVSHDGQTNELETFCCLKEWAPIYWGLFSNIMCMIYFFRFASKTISKPPAKEKTTNSSVTFPCWLSSPFVQLLLYL